MYDECPSLSKHVIVLMLGIKFLQCASSYLHKHSFALFTYNYKPLLLMWALKLVSQHPQLPLIPCAFSFFIFFIAFLVLLPEFTVTCTNVKHRRSCLEVCSVWVTMDMLTMNQNHVYCPNMLTHTRTWALAVGVSLTIQIFKK